jgi:hypothetical protein
MEHEVVACIVQHALTCCCATPCAACGCSEAEKQEELADNAALGGAGGRGGAAIMTCNATGVITSASKAAYTMFG